MQVVNGCMGCFLGIGHWPCQNKTSQDGSLLGPGLEAEFRSDLAAQDAEFAAKALAEREKFEAACSAQYEAYKASR